MELPNYRLLGILRSESITMPWRYRELVQGWIYEHLGELGKTIHDAPFSLFTYSFSSPTYAITDQGIKSELWCFRIASVYKEVLERLEQELNQGIELNNIYFTPLLVSKELLVNQDRFASDPIIVFSRDKEKRFLNPIIDQDFGKAVAASLKKRYEYYTGKPSPEVSFRFVTQPIARKLQYQNRRLIGFQGDIVLETTPEMRKFAQCIGLGVKTSCGMGMIA
ncbi:CRISPR-associated endoribonuclease Cas6 [Syntrophomonas palmitatica]|uniref:CRISPR-associated endoribonuclease Cas6 n=1 Tax=Syntrophomonas palmitatica TaxID=402877 RepID=UPI0006D210E8|nr:CRISPR-associated endoribonuclease Cas6 [Syntrophomonas palmitatica]